MIDLIADYMMFLKIFIFMMFLQWLMGSLGQNKFLFVTALLIGGYYIFFAKWDVLGLLLAGFVIFIMSGLGGFMQDIIFQYGSVMESQREGMSPSEEQISSNPYMMLRRMR